MKRFVALLVVAALFCSMVSPVAFAEKNFADTAIEILFGRTTVRPNSTEDYRAWSQSDPRWGSLHLGNSSDTVSSDGCLVTSVTKLIIQAGFKSPDSFNVATLVNWLNSNNGFTSGGLLKWESVSGLIPGFTLSSYGIEGFWGRSAHSSAGYNSQLLSYVKQGYHIALEVKSGGHWVAIDEKKSLSTGQIYIMDSSAGERADITLVSKYDTFNRAVAYTGHGDNTAPVISNIYVSDIDATGYTVHCTVTDNSGVNRVQFPAWTNVGGQDDLKAGWETDPAYSGTQNGSAWSYRVKVSDHNNESGQYITHIYAYDIYGNYSSVAVPIVEVPKKNDKVISNIYVSDIDATGYTVHCTVTSNSSVDRVQFPTWTVAGGQDDLKTGWETNPAYSGTRNGSAWSYRVKASDHNNESGQYITHIYVYDIYGNYCSEAVPIVDVPKKSGKIDGDIGDINGDSKLTIADMTLLARYIVGDPNTKQSVDKAKADVNGDGKINIMDLAYLSKLVAGWRP